MRLKTLFWGFILVLAIAFIVYEIVNETVVKPVNTIKNEVHETINEAFRLLEH